MQCWTTRWRKLADPAYPHLWIVQSGSRVSLFACPSPTRLYLPAVTNPAVLVHKDYKPIPPPRQSRAGVNRLSPLTQALDLKDQAYIDALSPDTPVHVKAALMRAWVDLEEIRLTLKGHGKPKPVEAKNARPKPKQRSTGPILYPRACDASAAQSPQLRAPTPATFDHATVSPQSQPTLEANVTPPESG